MVATVRKRSTSVGYNDEHGNPILLGSEIAQGGEGIVYHVQGNPDVVAKLYKPKVLNKKSASDKIKAACAIYDKNIAQFAAMPQTVIYSGSKVRGFIMEKITNFKEIHLLYGTKNRKKYFPNADWGFMVHAALNFANAVGSLHNKGIVIGDINQSNIMVNQQAMIKFIDCDSYQVDYQGKTYLCEVGVPEYTSPELQGHSFHGVHRTTNHDCFGLAVIIFKILMLGRHPYSGNGAPPEIENSIKQGCFCYDRNYYQKTAIFSDLYSTLSDELKNLFEQAFTSNIRPSASDWVKALDNFEKQLGQCSTNSSHKFNKNSGGCIWCDFEKSNFVPFKQTVTSVQPKAKPNYKQTPYNTNSTQIPAQPNTPSALPINNVWKTIIGIIAIWIIGTLINAGNNTNNIPSVPQTNYENTQTVKEQPQNENKNISANNSVDNKQNNTNTPPKSNDPNAYLSKVKQIIQDNWQTTYAINCTAIFTPPNNVAITNDEWNGDVARNLLLSTNIPKYVDTNGKTVPLVIKFSGHTVSSVAFQSKPIVKQNNSNSNTSKPPQAPKSADRDAPRPELMDFVNEIR